MFFMTSKDKMIEEVYVNTFDYGRTQFVNLIVDKNLEIIKLKEEIDNLKKVIKLFNDGDADE